MIRVSWGDPSTIEHSDTCTVELDRRVDAARSLGHFPPPAPPTPDAGTLASDLAALRDWCLEKIGWTK